MAATYISAAVETLLELQVASDGTFRSPVFYDYNDTAAYVNPNGTSNFKGQITIDRPDNSTWMDLQSATNGYGRIRMAHYGDPVIEFSDGSNGAGKTKYGHWEQMIEILDRLWLDGITPHYLEVIGRQLEQKSFS